MAVQLYVGTERGLLTVREGRRGWEQTRSTLPRRRIAALDYDRSRPNLLYIAVDNEGIYSSSDGGHSAVFRVGGDAHCVHVRKDAPKTIYAGMDRAMLWASGDGGVHWNRLDSFRELWGDPEDVMRRERPRGLVRAVIGVPLEKYGILAGLDPEGLAFSLDDGHIWNFIDGSPAGVRGLAVSRTNEANLYAATESGVARSINGGNDWLPSSDGLPAGPAAWVSTTADAIFTTVDGRLFRTGPGLPIWQEIVMPRATRITAVMDDPSDPRPVIGLFSGTAEGTIIRSTDGGGTWTEILHDLPPITCLAVTKD